MALGVSHRLLPIMLVVLAAAALSGCLAKEKAPAPDTTEDPTTDPWSGGIEAGPDTGGAPATDEDEGRPIILVYYINETPPPAPAPEPSASPGPETSADDDCGLLGRAVNIRLLGIGVGGCE